MSRFKLEFKLKQHTPIIHFQGDQHGATLRATELKPKLDKFLIEKLELTEIKKIKGKNKEVPKEVYKSWFIGGGKEHLALDYKARIEPENISITPFGKYPPLYFVKDNKTKSIDTGVTRISFISFKEELFEAITNHIDLFLLFTNFGTRQSKGYGSFTLDSRSVFPTGVIDSETQLYKFKSTVNQWEEDLGLFYKSMRSGVHILNNDRQTTMYLKSLAYQYLDGSLMWDKKAVKQMAFEGTSPPDSARDIKDLFGLSTNEDWMFKDGGETIDMGVKKRVLDSGIERYKSPIFFKPIRPDDSDNLDIYFFVPKSQFNQTYRSSKIAFKIKLDDEHKNIVLPLKSNFDFENFFDYLLTVDISSQIEDYQNEGSHDKLLEVYNSLERINNERT